MDLNELLQPLKDGTAANLSIAELSQRSQRCVNFILNRYPEAIHAKEAYDAEIRRKETAEQAERFQQQIRQLIGVAESQKLLAEKLITIAESQKLLAEKLDGQTNTLIALTRKIKNLTVWLVMLTSGLFALTVVLIVLTVTLISKEDRKTQTNWTQALTQTNKTESVIQTNSRPAQ